MRFEVLKRDGFQCRYCGARAPDVMLEVDHIDPVSLGGSDDFLNLTTACQDCNRGKSNIPLDEHQALQAQVTEIERIEGSAAGLDDLRRRRAEADELIEMQIDAIEEAIEGHPDFSLSETGRKTVKRWLKQDSVEALMTAVDAAAVSYLGSPGEVTDRDFERFISKVPAVAAFRRIHGKKSEAYRKAIYAAAIMRNRFEDFNEDFFTDAYTEMFEAFDPKKCDEVADEIVIAAKTYADYESIEEDLGVILRALWGRTNG